MKILFIIMMGLIFLTMIAAGSGSVSSENTNLSAKPAETTQPAAVPEFELLLFLKEKGTI